MRNRFLLSAKLLPVSSGLIVVAAASGSWVPLQAQCSGGLACGPAERFTPSATSAAADVPGSTVLSITQPGSASFPESFNTTIGGLNRSGVGSSSPFPGAAVLQLTGTGNVAMPTEEVDQPVGPSSVPQAVAPSTSALFLRLQPTQFTIDQPARPNLDTGTVSLWNSENVLYKQDSTGSPCSLNKQGPQIATCR